MPSDTSERRSAWPQVSAVVTGGVASLQHSPPQAGRALPAGSTLRNIPVSGGSLQVDGSGVGLRLIEEAPLVGLASVLVSFLQLL
ncbi:hypothetical protein NL676_016556 [Syzygium grande]|nr:hypothetical protein NL676_016556 [Syzygium grande]